VKIKNRMRPVPQTTALRRNVAARTEEDHPEKTLPPSPVRRSERSVAASQRMLSNAYESAAKTERYNKVSRSKRRVGPRPGDGTRMDLPRTPIATAIMRARVAAGLSQEDLAARLGHRQSYIAKLETDKRDATLGHLMKIAAETQRDPRDLFASMLSGWNAPGQGDGFESVRLLDFIHVARSTQNDALDLFERFLACHSKSAPLMGAWLRRPSAET
jgi:transcriptional regulator with XRE-family HTH domain